MKLLAKFQQSQIEAASLQTQPKRNLHLRTKLNDLWQAVIEFLETSSELYITQIQDKTGQTQWKAFDPITGQSAQFDSEEDVRVWVEERYYQHNFDVNQHNLLLSALR